MKKAPLREPWMYCLENGNESDAHGRATLGEREPPPQTIGPLNCVMHVHDLKIIHPCLHISAEAQKADRGT